jgi:hypothetical protein
LITLSNGLEAVDAVAVRAGSLLSRRDGAPRGVQRVVDQGRLARAGHAGDAGQQADGDGASTCFRLLPLAPRMRSSQQRIRAARRLAGIGDLAPARKVLRRSSIAGWP